MREGDAMQAAPAIILLVGRAIEGFHECRSCEQVQRIDHAAQYNDVPSILRQRHAGHIEEVEARGADTFARLEVLEQPLDRHECLAARREDREAAWCERRAERLR